MSIRPVSRGSGRNAPASAAYRAGELIRNERTGTSYDHRRRRDVLHKEVILPANLQQSDASLDWARDRARLWNVAERAESRGNSRVAREYLLALPAELASDQRTALAQRFSREIADRYGVAVDLTVHAPRPWGDPRNFHAHLLTTTREVTSEGLGAKTGLDLQGSVRAELGQPTSRQQFRILRERWAELANEALRDARLSERIDFRSLADRGIDREPRPSLPMAAVAALRRGERSPAAERLFGRYRERVAARRAMDARGPGPTAKGAARHDGVKEPDRAVRPTDQRPTPGPRYSEERRLQAVRDWVAYRAAQGRPVGPTDRSQRGADEVRRQAVESWRKLRAKEGEIRGGESAVSPDRNLGPDSAPAPRSLNGDSEFSV